MSVATIDSEHSFVFLHKSQQVYCIEELKQKHSALSPIALLVLAVRLRGNEFSLSV